MLSTWGLRALIFIFLCFGTSSTLLSKILYQTAGISSDGSLQTFSKPLLQNLGMFLGMSCCYVLYLFKRQPNELQDQTNSINNDYNDPDEVHGYSMYAVMFVPAFCDFLASWMINIGLLWINASIWQMVRGSEILFVALFRGVFLKKHILQYQWAGIFLVMTALSIIGLACVSDSEDTTSDIQSTPFFKILGVCTVVGAMAIQAMQGVIEEHLMKHVHADELVVVGLEGLWGLLLCSLSVPFAQWTSIPGIHEDVWEGLYMVFHNRNIAVLYTAFIFVVLTYNVLAMRVTNFLDSVARNIFDTTRTIFIWIALMIIHYTIDRTLGEEWNNPWSFVELFGFSVMASGLFLYYDVLRLPSLFEYPFTDDENDEADNSNIDASIENVIANTVQNIDARAEELVPLVSACKQKSSYHAEGSSSTHGLDYQGVYTGKSSVGGENIVAASHARPPVSAVVSSPKAGLQTHSFRSSHLSSAATTFSPKFSPKASPAFGPRKNNISGPFTLS
jgi:drug/metabolite transporter (DMT)-like permease